MDGSPMAWLPGSPTRSPAWRWLRALHAHRTGGPALAEVDDAWGDHARRYLADRDCLATDPGAAPPDPAIGKALALWTSDLPRRRWLLEALLLTGETMEEVARRSLLPIDVALAYHALFFAVRERPDATDWIVLRAVGCGPWNEFAGPLGGLWKYAAFTGGPVMLDVIVAVTLGRPFPEYIRAAFARDPVYTVERLRLSGMLTVALWRARTPEHIRALTAIRDEMLRLDGKERSGRAEAGRYDRVMARFLCVTERRSVPDDSPKAATRSPATLYTRRIGHTPDGSELQERPRPSPATPTRRREPVGVDSSR